MTRLRPIDEFVALIRDHLKAQDLPRNMLESEVMFHNSRAWRFDYAIHDLKIAFEYEGRGAGHLSVLAYAKDCEKYTWANNLGWTVVRITAVMISQGTAGPLIRNSINIAINPSVADPFRLHRIPKDKHKHKPKRKKT